jgi:predicted aldo/keto reductase-like oxidoreductase
MLYRKVKKTGDALSILGFGCMRLPQKKGTPGDGKIDEDRAVKQIHLAIENGINYFDTAATYHMGGSEVFLGKVFKDGLRGKIKLATKLPHWSVNRPGDMELLLKAQTGKLQTEYVDYYLLHALNGESWEKLKSFGVFEFLETEKKNGRIHHTGFSFHGDPDSFKEIIDAYDWDVCQIQYNYLDEKNQAGKKGLKYAASKDIGVIVMEPLRGGNIAGKVPPDILKIWNEAEIKRTPAAWGLRWVWNHPEVTMILSGMNEEAHIEENIQTANEAYPNSLAADELARVKRVKKRYRELMKVACTGCNYCMPCPSGVNIPSCFEFYNSAHMFKDMRGAKMMYLIFLGGVMADPAGASLCEKCGECVEKCPQSLPIPEQLETVATQFEDRWLKPKVWLVKQVLKLKRWKTLRSVKTS